ncbi:hypothetical protein EV647_4701 [Kribbella sp. VKM Ac-2566]|nr:hypothetical protein EV647_4701 [Kribbella sp. VKM Ac-2566]
MIKSQGDLFGRGSVGISGDNDTGDRGANCDYNPFNKVNFGDF